MGRSYFTFPAFWYVPLTTQSLAIILLPRTSQSDPRATIVQLYLNGMSLRQHLSFVYRG
jgi:hypothetical protein